MEKTAKSLFAGVYIAVGGFTPQFLATDASLLPGKEPTAPAVWQAPAEKDPELRAYEKQFFVIPPEPPPIPQAPYHIINFTGKIRQMRGPAEDTRIVLWVTTAHGEQRLFAMPEADGSYEISVPVEPVPNEPVDWALQTFSRHAMGNRKEGRRILLQDEHKVTIVNSLKYPSGLHLTALTNSERLPLYPETRLTPAKPTPR